MLRIYIITLGLLYLNLLAKNTLNLKNSLYKLTYTLTFIKLNLIRI